MTAQLEQIYAAAFAAAIVPDPIVTVDEWADANRILTRGEGNEVGPYRTGRVPFLREPMEYLSAHHPSWQLTIMKAAQMGVTQIIVNWIGYLISHSPAPILFYLPTREVAKQTSETRVDPMFEGTPILAEKVARPRSRDKRNTILTKKFTGGELLMRGANSPNAFRNIAARFVAGDDLDGWPGEVGAEGDPVTLIKKRAFTYPNRKYLWVSTPTTAGLSRIAKLFFAGDQRRYFLPCPECGEKRVLTWSGYLDHVQKKDGGHHRIEWDHEPEERPETAGMVCGACGKRSGEEWRTWMLDRGEWVPMKPGPRRQPSWHIPGLIAPAGWTTWGELADQWLQIQGNPLELKGFINTTLAETYEERGQGGAPESILDRLEEYVDEVPNGVGILVAAVDPQGDRLEVHVIGYGAGLESWVVYWESFDGDPAKDDVWFKVDEFRRRRFRHESGQEMRIECTVVDSGGHHTEQVYKFCKLHRGENVFAVKGSTETGRPIIERPTYRNSHRVPLYMICTDTAKGEIFSRLQIAPAPSPDTRVPGCMHFPKDRPWLNSEYAAQLTAEKGLWRYVKGKGMVRRWEKVRERNEILDLTVYCLAALHVAMRIPQRGKAALTALAARVERFSKKVEKPVTGSAPTPVSKAPVRQKMPKQGWVRGWRR